jgi:hypothetical protein
MKAQHTKMSKTQRVQRSKFIAINTYIQKKSQVWWYTFVNLALRRLIWED